MNMKKKKNTKCFRTELFHAHLKFHSFIKTCQIMRYNSDKEKSGQKVQKKKSNELH